jgi:hypothetical protein
VADLHALILAKLAAIDGLHITPSRPAAALRVVVERCAEVRRDASDPATVESCDELDAILAGELLRTIARELRIETPAPVDLTQTLQRSSGSQDVSLKADAHD